MAVDMDAYLRKNIDKINAIIQSWGPLPETPYEFVDTEPFSGRNVHHQAHLVKIGNQIKVRTLNGGDIAITANDMLGRFGIGRDFLFLLENRLHDFKDLLDQAAQ